LTVDGARASIEARCSMNKARSERPPGRESKEVIEGLGVISAGIWGGYGVKDHPTKPLLGFYEAVFWRLSALRVRTPGNERNLHGRIIPMTTHIVVGNKLLILKQL
jgi:hypothetical protein